MAKSQPQVNEAEYVVVGAGSAGCAVAGRLADAGHSVVLLEAGGPDKSMMFKTPGMITMIHAEPKLKAKFDWGYYHVPQPNLNNRKVPATRGRVVGGSSSVNGMIFVRGHRADFDSWADEGNKGWAWDDVLPTYKKLESWEGGASDHRGGSGPVKVLENHHITDAAKMFVAAGKAALGVEQTPDYNGAEQSGMHVIQESTGAGVRYSASRSYVTDNTSPSLHLVTHATVARVVIEGGRATGVEVLEGSTKRTIKATKEVIVSAGAYGSPQILQLSGVGHSDHLGQFGITVHADLPVGDNLHDHLFVPTSWHVDNSPHVGNALYFGKAIVKEKFQKGRTFMAHSVFESGAFLSTSHATDGLPDMQLLGLPWAYPAPNQDAPVRLKPDPRPSWSAFSTLIQPKSRGTVRLASADPTAAPLIDPQFLAEPDDLAVLAEGLEMIRDIMNHSSIARHVKTEYEPGRAYSGERLTDEIRNRATTVYHPVGSCRMGVDERAVVDPELKVRGIDGLRVADASIMPTIIRGNTNAPSIMIGEKCAELILKD
ncbi:GMC family oxidoreductase [Nocardioides piscis]|uniref:FAD-binding protein n=1 Tax=Nocardioides piscis TaxID=2714938 RepID=A0A6G7YEJ7_9ACTN|nr:GMC family oxidoreductase N-terminal domain-containing protein [Nocardioides piscis]QIK75324.1 FAD-binding protein [Nocardioides piscis]